MEIRNITPMTRSNATSFGMALKVRPEDVEEFTKFISNSKYKKNLVENGLKQFAKEQAKNKYADIKYDVSWDSFRVVPKEGAVARYGERDFPKDGYNPTTLDKVIDACDAEYNAIKGKSSLKRFVTLTKMAAKSLKAAFDTKYRNPQEFLPANLLEAGKYANKIKTETERVAKFNNILNQE